MANIQVEDGTSDEVAGAGDSVPNEVQGEESQADFLNRIGLGDKPAESAKPAKTAKPEETVSETTEETETAAESTDTESVDEVIEINGETYPADRVKTALENLDEFDRIYEGVLRKQEKFESAARNVEQERSQFLQEKEQFTREAQTLRIGAQAWAKIAPFLEQGRFDELREFVEAHRNGQAPAQQSNNLTEDRIREIIRGELTGASKQSALRAVDTIASSTIRSDPKLRLVFGDDLPDVIGRLHNRLSAEAKAGNFSAASSESEIQGLVRKHLNMMRDSEIRKAQKITGSGIQKQVNATKHLPAQSKTAGTRGVQKPKSLEVNYDAPADEFTRYIAGLIDEAATRSKED